MTVALFHSAFETIGGAEILVATQAQSLKRAGLDVCIATLAFDPARWSDWLDRIPVRVAKKPPWTDHLASPISRLRRTVPRVESNLSDCRAVLACNFPTNALLGASSISARRLWCCTEPPRHLHLVGTNPRLHERVTKAPGGTTNIERSYARRLAGDDRAWGRRSRAELSAFDVEKTKKLDAIYAISEFSRDSVRRVYGRTDAEIIFPLVRFPEARRHRSGFDRSGLKVLAHSRLETPKNVDTVVRGFALFLGTHPGSQLHIVGEGGERRGLEELTRKLSIAASVRFHGYLRESDLDKVYEACDVFALLPLDEPFGMVFPEAAARGVLLVGPDHGGPFEIMDGGRLGLVCDPFSPEALAEALGQVWALSDAEADERRAEADRACRARYSEAVIGPQLLRAFDGG